MKKEIIYFILFAFSLSKAISQTYEYVPFSTENAIWSEIYTTEEMPQPPWFYNYYDKIAMTGEDTTINGKTYKKLYTFNDSVFNINHATYLGGIREENKKIYYYGDTIRSGPMYPFQETLLYDFNLNIGDTICQNTPYCNGGNSSMFTVEDIDTVFIGNVFRKEFIIAYSNARWIEGIGNIQGLLFPTVGIVTKAGQPAGSIICFKQNDTIVYFNNQFPECMPLNVPAKPAVIDNIAIFPNPATTQLTLTLPENTPNATYTLYDMQGRLQLTGKTSNTQTEINVANLPRGMYVLKVITDKQIIAKKVVLQ